MEGDKRTLLKGIVIACIFGLIIVAALVLYSSNINTLANNNASEGISKYHFDGYLKAVEFGKPVNLTFSIESQEKVPTIYNYSIGYDKEQLRSGQINLQPGDQLSIPVNFVPREDTLVKLGETNVSVSRLRYNGKLSMVVEQGEGMEKLMAITSPQGYSLIHMGSNNATHQIDVNLPDKIILPLKLQIGSLSPGLSLFIFDPSKKEFFILDNSSLEQIGGPDNLNPPGVDDLSNFGYHIQQDVWTIENDHGDLNITRREGAADYRYAFKTVSAKVLKIRGGEVLSIKKVDFWVIVERNPEDLFS